MPKTNLGKETFVCSFFMAFFLLIAVLLCLSLYFCCQRDNLAFVETSLIIVASLFCWIELGMLSFVLLPLVGRMAFEKELSFYPPSPVFVDKVEKRGASLFLHRIEFAEVGLSSGEAKSSFLIETELLRKGIEGKTLLRRGRFLVEGDHE